ncbi:HelD family protein [Clostridium manihotivorum]|uniref:ATP-dependent DNA helicase n=1 Tax=Clostridium manihotivorum TaxID=2320868 RepID=A0A3R5QXT8_9CLOT|nr:UvrD-helicase domain-containing protein [Clostridium manihotivorum]QAA34812.1 ATP-dependent DNA helicase [Clostridium manihotivorum]
MEDITSSREKELQLLFEEEKLDETLRIINQEILNYLEKRKYISEYILDYRKNHIEEYRDDEDKVMEYFDHERYVKEEAFKTIDRKLKELTILKETPYFGKVSFVEEEDFLETLYIGRFGVTPEGSYDPIVVDWRAPVASLFYHGSLGKASYNSPAGEIESEIKERRQFIVKKGKLQGMFDSAVDVKDDILQMVLSSNSSDKLKDVIMTIQEEQDAIIRRPREKTVVVNGVAGSGKTTIALHRVAYLLYNNRKQLGDKVLILGPNAIFMEYISTVLPSLGEVGVKQDTISNFIIKQIKLNEEIMEFSKYMEKVLSGDKEFIEDIKLKKSREFIDKLDGLVKSIEEEYFKIKPVKYFGEEIVSAEYIKNMFEKDFLYMPIFRRSQKIKRVLISKIKEKRDERVWRLNKETEEYKKSLKPDDRLIEENNIEFNRKIKIREIVRELMNSRAELEEWIDNESIFNIYNRFNGYKQLTSDDLAPILYLMIKLDGKKSKSDIRHIVIDEAQDYSELQFRAIKELTGCKSMTIVGDTNQRLVNTEQEAAMLSIEAIYPEDEVENYSLNISYRSTMEIMNYANKFLKEEKVIPLVRQGKEVKSLNISSEEDLVDEILLAIEDFKDEGLESIAIITRNADDMNTIFPKIREFVPAIKFNSEDVIYNGGTVVIPSYFAKGLEFDGVVIVDLESDVDKEEDLIKYVMCTRALHILKDIKAKL